MNKLKNGAGVTVLLLMLGFVGYHFSQPTGIALAGSQKLLKQSTAVEWQTPNSGIVNHSGTGEFAWGEAPLRSDLLQACEKLSKSQTELVAIQERIIENQRQQIATLERAMRKISASWDLKVQ